jgi:hypothetical protein
LYPEPRAAGERLFRLAFTVSLPPDVERLGASYFTVTAEGDPAALFGVGREPGNQVIAGFDETVGDRIFALG